MHCDLLFALSDHCMIDVADTCDYPFGSPLSASDSKAAQLSTQPHIHSGAQLNIIYNCTATGAQLFSNLEEIVLILFTILRFSDQQSALPNHSIHLRI